MRGMCCSSVVLDRMMNGRSGRGRRGVVSGRLCSFMRFMCTSMRLVCTSMRLVITSMSGMCTSMSGMMMCSVSRYRVNKASKSGSFLGKTIRHRSA